MSSQMGEFKTPVGMEMIISQKILLRESDSALVSVCIDQVRAIESIPQDKLPATGIEHVMKMDALGNVVWVRGKSAWEGAEHSMMRFPAEPLSPGDYWEQQVEDANGSATPFFTRYLFKGLHRKNKRMAEFSTQLFTGPETSKERIKAGSGTFLFDLDQNWIDSCENFIEYSFEMPLPEQPACMITTKTKLHIEMERIK
ncbi:MAG: hypothetical protein Kow0029_08950 [Candidatus Rifleibacteriota bacterium]